MRHLPVKIRNHSEHLFHSFYPKKQSQGKKKKKNECVQATTFKRSNEKRGKQIIHQHI